MRSLLTTPFLIQNRKQLFCSFSDFVHDVRLRQRERGLVVGHPGPGGVVLLAHLRHQPGHAGMGSNHNPCLPIGRHSNDNYRKHSGTKMSFVKQAKLIHRTFICEFTFSLM